MELGSEEKTHLKARQEAAPASEVGSTETPRTLPATLQCLERSHREPERGKILAQALAQTTEAILILDKKLCVNYANAAFCRQVGHAAEDLVGKPVARLGQPPFPGMPGDHVAFEAWMRDRGSVSGEAVAPGENGIAIPAYVTIAPISDAQGDIIAYVVTQSDLRQAKQAEARLRERERTFRAITAAAQDAILLLDSAGRIVLWNEAASRLFGYTAEEALGQNAHLFVAPARYHDAHAAAWPRFAKDGQGAAVGKVLELEAQRKDGAEFPVELSVSAVKLSGEWHAVGIVRDITERKRAEEALKRTNRALRTISAGNMVLIHSTNEPQLLDDMCQTVVELGGYRLAWIGFAEHDEDKGLRQVASAGHEAGCLNSPRISWADNEFGQNPAGRAVRFGTPQIAKDILANSQHAPYREHALEYGYASCLALPLKEDDGQAFGVLNICAVEPSAFDDDEVRYLRELAGDLAFGVLTLRTRQQRDGYQQENLRSLDRLRETLLGAMRAIAHMVEMRDPYTAGHQTRVADLACAIARELLLDADRVEGLRLGAMIHDIGKISIPAEILNRPGRLSTPEFEIIKSHAEIGYEIIKDIDFPWPVATMVRQHHERLDGSGYPQGLKGDAICLEARILGVADTVDAMSAHRPYRPALGVEKALAVIEAGRGRTFDADVVDACVRLLRGKRYSVAEGQ